MQAWSTVRRLTYLLLIPTGWLAWQHQGSARGEWTLAVLALLGVGYWDYRERKDRIHVDKM